MFLLSVVIAALIPTMLKMVDRKAEKSKWGNKADTNKPKTKGKRKELSLRDLWEIEDIRNGIVLLTRNRYRVILRLGTINFDLLSENEQEVVENILMASAQGIDFPVQFLCTTEVIDTRSAIADLYTSVSSEVSEKRLSYANMLLSYLDELMSKRAVLVRHSYAVIGCDGEPWEKARGILEHRASIIANSLSKAKINVSSMTSEEIVDLLHGMLNRKKAIRPSDVINANGIDLFVSGKGVPVGIVQEETAADQ